jgi:hypothetical protein
MSANPPVLNDTPDATQPSPVAPSKVPAWLARAGRYALIVGGLCAAVGVLEGVAIGMVLAPRENPLGLLVQLSLDRGIVLGLMGGVLGAISGVFAVPKAASK